MDAPSSPNVKPKRKTRPRKVLSTKQIDSNLDQIYRKNASDSPLLRLPPEIRNRIWVLVLGGNTVHVTGYLARESGPNTKAQICSRGWTEREEADDVQNMQRVNADQDASEDYKSHYHHGSPLAPLSLNLLQASRQIHQEAALLPYKHNVFSFQLLRYMQVFLKAIILAQANAIENITIFTTAWSSNPVEGGKTFRALLKAKLKGVKHITCFMNIPSYTPPHFHGVEVVRKSFDSLLPLFESLPLQTARFAVHDAPRRSISRVSDTLCLELAKEAEQKLLAGPDVQSGDTRLAATETQ